MAWQRARRPEQKEQRRAVIIAAGKALLDDGGVQAAGINAIARRAGLSKANLYRYFESREEILLHIVVEELEAWAKRGERALAPLVGTGDQVAAAEALIDALLHSPRLTLLIPTIAPILERNVSVEVLVGFKTEWMGATLRLVNALAVACPELAPKKARQVVSGVVYLAAGMAPAADPTPAARHALRRPEVLCGELDLRAELVALVTALLRGLS